MGLAEELGSFPLTKISGPVHLGERLRTSHRLSMQERQRNALIDSDAYLRAGGIPAISKVCKPKRHSSQCDVFTSNPAQLHDWSYSITRRFPEWLWLRS